MAPVSSKDSSPWGSRRSRSVESSRESLQLLRNAHIFASTVRDLLELKILRGVSAPPLSLPQFHLLKLMSLNGYRQIGEVAGFLGVSPPSATKTIDKLERLGLITREPSREDRRAILLAPSAKGRRLVNRYMAAMSERLAPLFGEFNAAEIAALTRLLERFAVCLIKDEKESENGMCLRCAAYYDEACPVGKVRGGCPYQKMLNVPHRRN